MVVTAIGVGEPFNPWTRNVTFAGDGGAASRASIWAPTTVVADLRGGYYFTDSRNDRIRHVDASGKVATVVGSGMVSSSLWRCAWDVPALQACLAVPHGITLDREGRLIITDTFHNVITRLEPDGMLRRIAGSGEVCQPRIKSCGEGGPALQASLRWPTIARDTPQGLVIADTSNRVMLVRDGVMTRLAGTGEPGFSGDGGPATLATLFAPADAVPYRGGWLISDGNNCRLRFIDAAGRIGPFAGYGSDLAQCWKSYGLATSMQTWGPAMTGDLGDGGSAVAAKLSVTGFLALDGDTVYVTDFLNSRVRRIHDGVIDTVIGTGQQPGVSTDGPAVGTTFRLGWTSGVAWDPTRRTLLVSEGGTNRILLARQGPSFAPPVRDPAPAPPQSQPADVRVVAGQNAMVVSWGRGSDATRHDVRVTPARGGASLTCRATVEDFCVVRGMANMTAYVVTVTPANAAGLGRRPVEFGSYAVPTAACVRVLPRVPSAADKAMAQAIQRRLDADPIFRAEFTALLARSSSCNPELASALRAALAAAIRADPAGPVAQQIRAAMVAAATDAALIKADPSGPAARRADAIASIM